LFLTATGERLRDSLNTCFNAIIKAKGDNIATLEIEQETTDSDPREIVFYRESDGRQEIKSGRIAALVHHLCHKPFSELDARALVKGYPALCNDHSEFGMLILNEYNALVSTLSPESTQLDALGLFGLLHLWVVNRKQDAGLPYPHLT
jgi:hypothetical protein